MIKKYYIHILLIISIIIPKFVFAQETIIKGDKNIQQLVNDIDLLFQKKYTSSYEYGDEYSTTNNIYKIIADGKVITNTFDLKLKIEEYILKETVLNIDIIDKGNKTTITGEVVGREYSMYDRYQTSESLYNIYESYKNEKVITNIELFDRNNLITDNKLEVEKVVITFLNGQKIDILKGSDKLDFDKPVDVNGNRIDLTNIDITTSDGLSIAKAVVGFEKAKELDTIKEFDIPSKLISSYKVIEDGFIEEKDLNEFYNGSYSQKGKDFIEGLADKVFYYNGNKFNLNYDILNSGTDEQKVVNNISKLRYSNNKYWFDIYLNFKLDLRTSLSGNQNFKLSIYSDDQMKIESFRKDVINAVVNGDKDIVNRQYDVLAGNDRFETSVQISKEYTRLNKANSIVLVGKDAVVDGLSAAPFAKYKNGPILLSDKNNIPQVVMDEIKRIFNLYSEVDTVYIIGGENTISNDVLRQIIDEIKKVRVIRISGKDRYETSINISNRMDLSSLNKVYLVGGNGEADAMSVAPLASNQGIPVIVSPKNGINEDLKYLFEKNENITTVDIIGGRNSIDTQVLLDIKNCAYNRDNNKDIELNRISGEDRKETNAEILELFDSKYVSKIVVAKDGIKNKIDLVDSLGAASLGYPIVLSTDTLAISQLNSLKKIINDNYKLIQVGNGIDESTIKKLLNLK